MIKKTSLSRVPNDELNTLVTRILVALAAVKGLFTDDIATLINLMTELNDKLTKSLNASRKSKYSELLKMLDDLRDNAFRAIRDAILGASRRLNEAFSQHATKLLAIFKRHGWSLWKENYQVESSKLNSLFVDLDEEDAKVSLAAINLTEWLDELKKAQSDFEDAFQNKASDDLRKQYTTMQEIRPELINMLHELLNGVNSRAKYSKNKEEYTVLVDTLNNILAETAVLTKSRKTRNSHDDKEKV